VSCFYESVKRGFEKQRSAQSHGKSDLVIGLRFILFRNATMDIAEARHTDLNVAELLGRAEKHYTA